MINLDTCKFCLWGLRNSGYDTFMHIYEAFERALKFMGRDVIWVDAGSNISGIDFSNTFFITLDTVVDREINSIPLRKDCFYAAHNGVMGHRDRFDGLKLLTFGMLFHQMGDKRFETTVLDNRIEFFWATNLLPHEIIVPNRVFRSESRVINYVSSAWNSASQEISDFGKTCSENGIEFRRIGGGFTGAVSIPENVRLVRESYMAPALSSQYQIQVGHTPCRIFKNISYGQFGITNSPVVNDIFDGELIYDPDPKALFYKAKSELAQKSLDKLLHLMDVVSTKHTYLNRIDSLMNAARDML
jgi:hypothetical protein